MSAKKRLAIAIGLLAAISHLTKIRQKRILNSPRLIDSISHNKTDYTYENKYFWTERRVGMLTGIATFLLAVFALIQAVITRNQLIETRDEQRPWIYAQLADGKADVRFESGQLTIFIKFIFFNTGHLPANDIWVTVTSWPTIAHLPDERRARRIAACGKDLRAGFSLFPGQQMQSPANFGGAMQQSNIDKFWADYPHWFKDRHVFPAVVACLQYKDPSGNYHHTPYAFNTTIDISLPTGLARAAYEADLYTDTMMELDAD